MSKKIIYLLSLLMALSLVFASCKKNAAGTGPKPDDLIPPTDNETGREDANQDSGFFESYDKIPTDKAIKEYEVFQNDGTDFYRNPVVVSMGDGRVFVFAELRYKRAGAANDVGIDGEGAVDIVYKVSKNSGYDWDSQTYYVVANSSTKEQAHGAPNVFLLGNNKIVVVATAGSGIGRTDKLIADRTPSKVEYAIGTITDTKIAWGGWQEVQLTGSSTIQQTIENVDAGGNNGEKFNQYATAPGRGFVEGNNILLSLVIANQGSTQNGQTRELMGRYVLKGTVNSTDVTWEEFESPIAYTTSPMDLGPWKETQLYGGTIDAPKFFVVPSPWTSGPQFKLGKATKVTSTTATPPTPTDIRASEGSAGYVDLKGKWFGTDQYDPKNLGTGKNYSIFLHVADTSANLTMRVIDNSSDAFTQIGQGWLIDTVGKSSSVDMLPDGTIIFAAEKGGDANAKNYGFFFYRYSQAFVATQTAANNQ